MKIRLATANLVPTDRFPLIGGSDLALQKGKDMSYVLALANIENADLATAEISKKIKQAKKAILYLVEGHDGFDDSFLEKIVKEATRTLRKQVLETKEKFNTDLL